MSTRLNRFMCYIYIISILSYLYFIILNRRDYQDSWILQDILLSTLFFIFIFVMTVILNDDNRIIALICSSFVVIMNLVPAMKYESFYGIADVTLHYRFIDEIMNSGYIPTGTAYSGTPGMQIFISLFSLISWIPINTGFKYTIPISFGVYSLIIYFISNKMIQNKTLQKYMIIASSFPMITIYYLVGTIFPLLFLVLLGPLVIIGEVIEQDNKIKYRIILLIMLLAILISHTVTSFLFILFSTGSIILLTLYDRYQQKDIFSILIKRFYIVLFFSIILYTFWWMYESGYLFSIFAKTSAKIVQHLFIDVDFRKAPIPQRFFDIPFVSKIQILSIYYIADFIIAILSIYGIFLFFREKIYMSKTSVMLYSYLISFLFAIFLILGFEFLIKFGDLEYYRFIDYGIIFSPFFVGLSFFKLLKTDFKFIEILIMSIIIAISLIQFFPCQPLTPKANIINSNINGEEQLMYFHQVNTIYQKKMISFASNFSSNGTIIASDIVTRIQMISFFNQTFENIGSRNSTLLWYSPLEKKEKNSRWNLFLLHWNGKSGSFVERAEFRSNNIISINRNIQGRNVIYDNGESFIIQS